MAVGVLALTAGTSVATYAKQGSDSGGSAVAGCSLKPNPRQSDLAEQRSCFSVDASLDRAPGVGETATIRFTVTAEHAAKGVRVEADLPAGLTWAALPAGMAGTTVASPAPITGGALHRAAADSTFKARQVRTYEGRVTAVAPGSAEIRVRAGKPTADNGSVGEDVLFLSVGSGPEASAFGVVAPAAEGATTAATMPPVWGAVPLPAAKQLSAAPVTGPNDDAPWSAGAKAAAGTACVTGRWAYVDKDGATRFVANATVEVWDADTDSAHDRIAAGTTSVSGEFRLCFPNTDAGGQDAYVKFVTANSRWRVQKTGTTDPYVFTSRTVGNVVKAGTVDFGPLKPADPAMQRGLAAFDAAQSLWLWVPGTCWDADDAACRVMVVNWTPGGTGGTHYRRDLNESFLNGVDPDARTVVLHEMAHALMDDLYEDSPPPNQDCGSPHYIQRISGPGCAWTEGFAEWVPASVSHDPYFRWPSGAALNLETPNASTAGWDKGDAVEGRVAGALIDITDYFNDGTDTYGEGPLYIWSTVAAHKPNTFREFWNARKADGFNTAAPGALGSVRQNTISY